MERKLVPVERCVHEKSQGEELVFNDTPTEYTNHLRHPYAQIFQVEENQGLALALSHVNKSGISLVKAERRWLKRT